MRCKTCGAFMIAVLFFASAIPCVSSEETAAQFLNREKDARAAAMGDAFTTMSGDVETVFYNPGGLAFMEEAQATGSYTNLEDALGESSYGFLLSGGAPVYLGEGRSFKGVLGFGLQIENQGALITDEEEAGKDWAFTLSYANHSPKAAAGLSFKLIHEEFLDESDTSMAVDLGVQYDIFKKFLVERDTSKVYDPNFGVRAGISLQNLGMKMKVISELGEQSLPRQLSFGIATNACYRLRDMFPDSNAPIGLAVFRLYLGLEFTAFVDKLSKSDEDLLNPEFDEKKAGVGINAFKTDNMEKNFGGELWFFDVLALRAGYRCHPDMPDDMSGGDKIVYGFGLRFPISHIIGFSKTESAGLGQFDRFYREADRQIFLEFDLSVNTDPGVPGADRAKTITLKIGT